MAKLILDEAAMQLAMTKLAGSPIFAGPDGGLLAPGIVDLIEGEDGARSWQPGDKRTSLIVLGGEACRDLVFHAPTFAESETRRRAMKSLVVSVCNLMDVTSGLLTEFNDEASRSHRRAWPRADQDTYTSVGRRLRKQRLRGPVRRVRDKLGAHLDPTAFAEKNLRLRETDLLGAMGDALVLLMLSLNHPARSFAWIRWLAQSTDGQHTLVETMFDYPACVCWVTDREGHVKEVGPVRTAEDPRWQIQEHIRAATATYNEMVGLADVSLPLIRITWTEDLLRAEQQAGSAIDPQRAD